MAADLLSDIVSRYAREQVFCLVDEVVLPTWQHLSEGVCAPAATLTLQVSEEIKHLATVQRLWDWLMQQGATRSGLLICVGGGVITDLGGFAAATYRRGMDYLNVPTTLLAMVDAAVGGKTGFNYGGLKNAIGVIRQPVDTILFTEFLDTLPSHAYLSGYAELIKTALLDSSDSFRQAIMSIEAPVRDSIQLLSSTAGVKRRLIASDPDDRGARHALNFGHTVGHALEELSLANHLSPLSHGYAVLYGLVTELYLSVVLLGLDRAVLRQVAAVMTTYYGRPQVSCKDYDRLLDLMASDKKNTSPDSISFTLLSAIGQPQIDQVVPRHRIIEALDYLFSL